MPRHGCYTPQVRPPAGSSRVLGLLGLAAWLAAGASVWGQFARRPELLLSPRWAAWLLLFCVFGASYWWALACLERAPSGSLCRVLLAAQTLAALGLAVIEPRGLLGALLVVIAAQLIGGVGTVRAWCWMIAQTVTMGALFVPAMGAATAWTLAGAFAAFEGFSLYTWEVAARERQSSRELTRVNAELLAAQSLLAARSRADERLRISQDLHDVAGHHLTALSLALEAARHSPAQQVGELLARAQALTRQLLQDVRRVVSALRDSEVVDLSQALGALSAAVQRPHVHLTAPEGLRIGDADKARAALRCVCLLYTSPSPRDRQKSRMPSSA